MRYNGKGNPASVLVACLTLGFLPQILLLLGIIWVVQEIYYFLCSVPIWMWAICTILGFMMLVYALFCKEDK